MGSLCTEAIVNARGQAGLKFPSGTCLASVRNGVLTRQTFGLNRKFSDSACWCLVFAPLLSCSCIPLLSVLKLQAATWWCCCASWSQAWWRGTWCTYIVQLKNSTLVRKDYPVYFTIAHRNETLPPPTQVRSCWLCSWRSLITERRQHSW